MEIIPEEVLDIYRSELMGKRVQFLDEKKKIVVGTLQYLGYNNYYPKWNLCITVDCTPFSNIQLSDLKLYERS